MQRQRGAQALGERAGACGKALGQPALSRTEGRARAHSDDRGANAFRGKACQTRGARPGRGAQFDGERVGQTIEPAGATEEFEIVERLVRRDGAGAGHGDGAGEQR